MEQVNFPVIDRHHEAGVEGDSAEPPPPGDNGANGGAPASASGTNKAELTTKSLTQLKCGQTTTT
jgi:hypothetical protein